jgi:hypothetical protein
VLEYAAWAAAEDAAVLAVCAHRLGPAPVDDPAAVAREAWFSPIVWGTWASRWDGLLRDTWDHTYAHRGWDWRVNSLIAAHDLAVVKPALSRSQHIGRLGGAHCTPGFFPETVSETFREHYGPQAYRETG